jgi:hypothetical protein
VIVSEGAGTCHCWCWNVPLLVPALSFRTTVQYLAEVVLIYDSAHPLNRQSPRALGFVSADILTKSHSFTISTKN